MQSHIHIFIGILTKPVYLLACFREIWKNLEETHKENLQNSTVTQGQDQTGNH